VRIGRWVAVAGLAGLAAGCGGTRPELTAAPAPTSAAAATGTTPAAKPAQRPAAIPIRPAGKLTPAPPKPKPPAPGGGSSGGSAGSAGNAGGGASIPAAARAVDTSHPDHVIGTGTPASCTSAAVVTAVAAGGIITFNCGPGQVTIPMAATAKVRNDHAPDVVLDGGGRVTLDGQGQRRILYQNTCDPAQVFTNDNCTEQATPRLVVQNMGFTGGNATGDHPAVTNGGGGGAIFVRGGQVRVINSRFSANRCDSTGPDLGGAAIRALDIDNDGPVYVVGSTFAGGVCSNGAGLSSIGVSWEVLDSVFTGNQAIGRGANPASPGTPGGGSGGAIYTDGDTYTLHLAGTRIENNTANEGGGAVFYVSNDHSGHLLIDGSRLVRNPSKQFETAGFPGIFYQGVGTKPQVSGSVLQ
jgi:hypothetical protein